MKTYLHLLLLVNLLLPASNHHKTHKPAKTAAVKKPVVIPTIDCKGADKTIFLSFTSSKTPAKSWSKTITLPTSGIFTEEAHYATQTDKFPGDGFPSTQAQNIQEHLNRSLSYYKSFDPAATFKTLYRYKFTKLWTPEEGGHFGQGSVGSNPQLMNLSAADELWMLNMMWGNGQRPRVNTKFLLSANGKNVVVIAGYETGPAQSKFIGGVTGEVHRWLITGPNSTINISLLADQSVSTGPCGCN